MTNLIYEKKSKMFTILGLIIVTIGINIALQLKNISIAIITMVMAAIGVVVLLNYRKKHKIIEKDERAKRISQMAGNSTFVLFYFGFLLIGTINVFYPLEKTMSAHTLASIIGGIGLAMIFCFLIFYSYYKQKY